MCDYELIGEEELWGVPVEDLPEEDLGRNYFNEAQRIDALRLSIDDLEELDGLKNI